MIECLQEIAVYGFIINENKELLIIQRAEYDSMPGIWEIPGGRLEFGEQPNDGVKREIQEECGIDVRVLYPIFTASIPSLMKHNKQVVRITYLCIPKNKDVILSRDHSAYRWIYLSDINKFHFSEFLVKLLEECEGISHLAFF